VSEAISSRCSAQSLERFIGVALTFPILSGTEPDGLVYLAAWVFFGAVGALLGAGLAYGFLRLYRAAKMT
jgi:hypothetical protein